MYHVHRNLIRRLKAVDTASLCDADKRIAQGGVKVLDGMTLRSNNQTRMVGFAKTVQLERKNDFLSIIKGLHESQEGDVLCINSLGSNLAVAGGLFATEAQRRKLEGIVLDGPARDIRVLQEISMGFYSLSINPYSGTMKDSGITDSLVKCGGVEIRPGDILVGDTDGVIVGSLSTMENIVELAETIVADESDMMQRILNGESLTNKFKHLL